MKHSASLVNAISFDIEDWFHILGIDELGDPDSWDRLPSIVTRYTEAILRVLERKQVRATFFVLGWIAERYPDLVREIWSAGHEIGSHSHWHRTVYTLSRAEFRRDTLQSVHAIHSACGIRPRGYRAPSFSIRPGSEWALDELLDAGFDWDASLFPAARGHGGYPCPDIPHMFRALPSGRGIPELPLSQWRWLGRGVCFSGGGYFRLAPGWLINAGFKALNSRGVPAVVYLHPRDFATDCPRVRMPLHRQFKCYVGLASTMPKLERMLDQHEFSTCGRVLELSGHRQSKL